MSTNAKYKRVANFMVGQSTEHFSSSKTPKRQNQKPQRSSLRKWGLSLGIIVGGIIIAKMMLNYNSHRALVAAIKHGVLIAPPATVGPLLNLEKENYPTLIQLLKGKWGLIYINTGMCKDTCVNNIAKMLKIRDQFISDTKPPYLMLITLTSNNSADNPIKKMLEQQYPTIWYINTNIVGLQQFLNHVPTGSQTLATDRLYIVNKQFEAIASYNPATPTNDLSSDYHSLDKN